MRISKYIVVQYGDLNRGEHMNVAVLAWDRELGDAAPVTMYILEDWTRVHTAFPVANCEELQKDVVGRLSKIKTLKDYRYLLERVGPYTAFDFTEERPSTTTPEETAAFASSYFLRQPVLPASV